MRDLDDAGSYLNLLDVHMAFQIDGNFGGGTGIEDLLVLRHLGPIDLLSAFPSALTEEMVRQFY